MAVLAAVDAGTTGIRTIAFDANAQVVTSAYRELSQHFPRPGWVEHDPDEIWSATLATLAEVASALEEPIAAIGITNQRETTVVWDRSSGAPLHRAIVWQDRRSAAQCERLRAGGHLETVRERTGLVLDPYFSATKLSWLFADGGLQAGPNLAFGTVDSWLIWNLTGGRSHVTDSTNASRTLLFDINMMRWDEDLCDLFGVPPSCLPEVLPSSGRLGLTTAELAGVEAGIPISGCAGDQQSALFGQACFDVGMTKNTYGTGSFVLMNVGSSPPAPTEGLLSTVAWSLGSLSEVTYALEGSVFVTGAAIQWMRDELGLITSASEIGPLANSVPDTGGAYLVPAFTGLGSPWWDPHARGAFVGFSRGIGKAHLARAVLEAMAYQSTDVVKAMQAAAAQPPSEMRVDGGASVLDMLLQMQADLLGIPVLRSSFPETTAAGAALLAGLAEGIWSSTSEISACWKVSARFDPTPDTKEAQYAMWLRAVDRSRSRASKTPHR